MTIIHPAWTGADETPIDLWPVDLAAPIDLWTVADETPIDLWPVAAPAVR